MWLMPSRRSKRRTSGVLWYFAPSSTRTESLLQFASSRVSTVANLEMNETITLESVLIWVKLTYTWPIVHTAAIMLTLGIRSLQATLLISPFGAHLWFRKSRYGSQVSSMLITRLPDSNMGSMMRANFYLRTVARGWFAWIGTRFIFL